MLRYMATGATALALLAVPGLAQEAGGDAPAAGAGTAEAAIQSATEAGMQNVRSVEGAFVLEGTSEAGMPVLMVVGPAGELIALASPISAPAGAQDVDAAEAIGAEADPDLAEAEPGPGEPAEGGYMATQVNPAPPGWWDPMTVQAAIRNLELGLRGAAGQVSEPAVNQQ